MRKDELMICLVVIVFIILLFNADHSGSFGINEKTAKFIRSILNEYFARITGFAPFTEAEL
jgi:hypothetical protein